MNGRGMFSIAGVALALLVGCSEGSTSDPTSPRDPLGTLIVATSTTGEDLPASGYELSVDGRGGVSIEAVGERTISELAVGSHTLELSGFPWNCTVAGENPRAVTVPSGGIARSVFEVLCGAMRPLTGSIVFWSWDGSSRFELWAMDADGSDQRMLGPGAEPAVSPDGARILFVHSEDIWVSNTDGSDLRNLTDHPALDFRPRWSPDGNWIVFTSSRNGPGDFDLFLMEPDGEGVTNLTRSPGNDNGATWSPDGSRIAFTTDRTGEFEIFAMDLDGSDPVNLTQDPVWSDYAPAWSPDGERIAYASVRNGNKEIIVMNHDGPRMNLTNHPGQDEWPSWSPDGKLIAFSSNRTGDYEVFVMNDDGSAPRNLSNRPETFDFAGFPQAWVSTELTPTPPRRRGRAGAAPSGPSRGYGSTGALRRQGG